MEFLMFVCARTRQVIDSGIALDAPAYFQTRNVKITLRCPHCRGRHDVRVGEGYVAVSPPLPIYRSAA